jgi:hypothetical protein
LHSPSSLVEQVYRLSVRGVAGRQPETIASPDLKGVPVFGTAQLCRPCGETGRPSGPSDEPFATPFRDGPSGRPTGGIGWNRFSGSGGGGQLVCG